MVNQEMLKRLGRLLRDARTGKKLSQEEVAEMIGRTQGQYSDIERAYMRPGSARGSVPDDEFLALVADALGIPIQDLHAALGRVPAGGPAAQLVREKLDSLANREEIDLTTEQMDALIDDIEDYANMRLSRTVRQTQEIK